MAKTESKSESKPTIIPPTVGRVVWYRPGEYDHPDHHVHGAYDTEQPFAALITHVWSDESVNLAVFHPDGSSFPRQSVLLIQDGETVNAGEYCEWMPYQKGQAAKTEALQAADKTK